LDKVNFSTRQETGMVTNHKASTNSGHSGNSGHSSHAGNQLPQTLLSANMELSQRMGALFQENNQRWSEFVARAFGEGRGNMGKLLNISNGHLYGQALNDLMEGLSQCANCNRILAQQALENQKLFMSGLTEILLQWQQRSSVVPGDAGDMPWNNMFADMIKQMNANFLLFNANQNEKRKPS